MVTMVAAQREDASEREAELETAQRAWSRLAVRLAASGRVRLSRDGGRNYPRRYERFISTTLPSQPAAVRVYDGQGCAATFVVDLDAKTPAGRADVARDVADLIGRLERAGLRSWFTDRSPSGGRHVYVPLADPVPFVEARAAAAALAQLLRTVDMTPMANVTEGCLRPPGARHKSGGFQVLDGPVEAAEAALDAPNGTAAWQRFLTDLRSSAPDAAAPVDVDAAAAAGQLEALRGFDEPSETYQAIARTGDFDTRRYSSPSEARQAVLWAATAAGWALADVARRIHDGTWPGLASMYARYSPRNRSQALARDWHKAQAYEQRRRSKHSTTSHGSNSVRVCTTSPHKTQAGGRQVQQPADVPTRAIARRRGQTGRDTNRWIREWLAAVDFLHEDSDLGIRAVLYALAEAAAKSKSVSVDHGHRALAIATGLHRSTVTRVLAQLAAEPGDRALIEIVQTGHGIYAHTYELRIPALLQPACAAKPWRAGRIYAIRPAFRELGLAAAFVYAALEQHHHRSPGVGLDVRGEAGLAKTAGLGVTATYDALHALAAHGLADLDPAGPGGPWRLGTASLGQLAEAWGIAEAVRAQIQLYREERAQWQAWLVEHGLLSPSVIQRHLSLVPHPPEPPGPPDTGPARPMTGDRAPMRWHEDTATLVDLLHEQLGAIEIHT